MKVILPSKGLNPCFNGRRSQSVYLLKFNRDMDGLNPCFNGRRSQSYDIIGTYAEVLMS